MRLNDISEDQTFVDLRLSVIMPTVSWEECFAICAQVLLTQNSASDVFKTGIWEFVVVFDGSPSEPPAWLANSPARLLCTGKQSGPAYARNFAAKHSSGEILVFIDADVAPHAEVLQQFQAHFVADPNLAAVFGSYDDTPVDPGQISQFRNLLHHYIHCSHQGPAGTFWAGCGAVRRQSFFDLGGFDTTYCEPSVEDIEFGMRLIAAGGFILLDPTILCTHHKRWTLRSMLVTDIRQRAIPWTRLLLQRSVPDDLNLSHSARWSALFSLLLLIFLSSFCLQP